MDKILICDDSTHNTELLNSFLQRQGYQTYTADTGISVLTKAKLFIPDLIILNIGIPDVNCYELCDILRKDFDTMHSLILLICNLETKDGKMRALASGADDIMEKSLDLEVLLVKVASLLRIKGLSDQLKAQYLELEEKNKILNTQLKMSKKVQQALMKEQNFTFHDMKIITRYRPALDVGGDFYEFTPIDDDRIAVAIGDVSGHGISAALLTAMINMMIKNQSLLYHKPDEFLFQMNNQFYNVFENTTHGMYACMFYAIINTAEKKIYYSNAGQVLPIFFNKKTNEIHELVSSGIPVGLMENSVYESHEIKYNTNDILLLYTDGLADVYYKETPELFVEKLKIHMMQNFKASPENMAEDILTNFCNTGTVEDSKKYLMDDVSLMLCNMG